MGTYRAPSVIQNSEGFSQRNKAIATFNAGMDKTFDEISKQRLAESNRVAKDQAAFEKRRLKDMNKLNKELTESGLLGKGDDSSTAGVVKKIRDEYAICAGSLDPKCVDLMAHWKALPDEISKGAGVSEALTAQYAKIMEIAAGDPGSLDIDRTNPILNRFGQEFVENGGKNVQCKYDGDTHQIYWEIGDVTHTEDEISAMTAEQREDAGIPDDYTKGDYTIKGEKIYNNALVKSQLDPNNKDSFFPTHGDPKKITNIMHNGAPNEGVDGLGVGLKDDVLTIKKKDANGVETEEVITKPADINTELRNRLSRYDFKDTLNSPISKRLYSASIDKNIEKLESLKDKDPPFNTTEIRLLKTWYGDNYEENLAGLVEDTDPITRYQKNKDEGGTGSSEFGVWVGSNSSLVKSDNANALFQRGVVSNGLILDYEEEYLLPVPSEEGDIEDIAMEGAPSENFATATEEDKVKVQQKFDSLKPGETMKIINKNGEVEEIVKPILDIEEEVKLDPRTGKPEEAKEEKVLTKEKGKELETEVEVEEIKEKGAIETEMTFTNASGETKVIDQTKLTNPTLKTDKKDGKDYIRRILNFENSMGSFSGGSVGNYGFSGTGDKGGALLKEFNKAKGTKEEKALATIDKYIIGEGPDDADVGGVKGNTTILKDLGMTRDDFDKLPDDVKRELVDWKFNSGRGTTDLVMIAGGGDWDGSRAFTDASPKSIGDIDISKLDVKSLKDARQQLYKGRIKGLEKIVSEKGKDAKDKNGEKYSDILAAAKKGYKNSQQYRGYSTEDSKAQEEKKKPVVAKEEEEEVVTTFRTSKNLTTDAQTRVDKFKIQGSSGAKKANILKFKDGEYSPIEAKIAAGLATVTGVRAVGEDLIVDINVSPIATLASQGKQKSGPQTMGKFVKKDGGFKFEPNEEVYSQLTGDDKKDFDAFVAAVEDDAAFGTQVAGSVAGTTDFEPKTYK